MARKGTPRISGTAKPHLTPIIIFVRNFKKCLKFYTSVFGLKPVRLHGQWAEFQVGDIRLALHGNYKGPRQRQGRPLALHFVIDDIARMIERIKKYGGNAEEPRRLDFRPSELKVVLEARFTDPDKNQFEVQQILRRYD